MTRRIGTRIGTRTGMNDDEEKARMVHSLTSTTAKAEQVYVVSTINASICPVTAEPDIIGSVEWEWRVEPYITAAIATTSD